LKVLQNYKKKVLRNLFDKKKKLYTISYVKKLDESIFFCCFAILKSSLHFLT